MKKLGIGNIEGGKTVELINEYLDITTKDLFTMAKVHNVAAKKLKGHVIIKISIQPLSNVEDHYAVSSEVHRVVPKITNSSLAVVDDGGLFVQERGSDKDSPRQTTIDNFIEEVEHEGEYITDGQGNKISTRTGEIKKA